VNPFTGATLNTRYNNPAGLGTAYTVAGKVNNFGPTPTIKVFSVQNAQLVSQALGAAAATPLFDNIVQLQAQYGRDNDNDGVVDVYDETTPVNSAAWAAVLAIRIAVVARSSLYEKDEVSPATIRLWEDSAAAPTTTGPVWTLTALTGDAVFDADAADRRHYRYKVFQTVIPLRNMIWRPY
jgi:type IV pilus assembly protein PilW